MGAGHVTIASADVTYTYDGGSSLRTSMTDSSGTSSYAYDNLGRLTSYTPPVPSGHGAVTYAYNKLGQKTSITSGSYGVTYEYFANGWLKNVKYGANTVAAYAYDAVGNRTDVDYGNGTHIDYDYDTDPRYRTSMITHKYGANVLATIGYPTRDKVGNPESITDWTGAWTYGYDANNRLDWALAPNFAASGDPTRPVPDQPAGGDYEYDWVGNRVRPPADPGPVSDINKMVYNDADQLLMWPGRHGRWNGSTLVPGYVYDNAGNLTAVKDVYGSSTLASYTYTDAGLLAVEAVTALIHKWDADCNRVALYQGEALLGAFVYDTTAGIPAVVEEHTETNTVYCIREPGGGLIARVHPTEGIRYYHFDELGSARLLTDANGTVTDRYAYDAYGSLLAHDRLTGSVNQPYQYVGQLGYYTHWMEPDFGLLQLGVRFYDAEVGRFGQRDTVHADAISRYVYAQDVPSVVTDPTGRWPGFRKVPVNFWNKVKPYIPGKGDCIALLDRISNYELAHPDCPGGMPWDAAGAQAECSGCCSEIANALDKFLHREVAKNWCVACVEGCMAGFYAPWMHVVIPIRKWVWW